ncbi:MAG: DUF433 domain-containing protein [Candidatus Binatia bacterium]
MRLIALWRSLNYHDFVNSTYDLSDLLVRTGEGVWRIAGTRVSLDSVVYSFKEGATPEEICQDYPALSLAQVYGAIAYYLNNQQQIDTYLKEEKQASENLRQQLQIRHGDFLRDLRRRLMAHRQSPNPE